MEPAKSILHNIDELWKMKKKYLKNRPFVSVVTATYNRRRFIPQLLKYYSYQTYPKSKLEFIILDDGEDKIKDIVDNFTACEY